MEAPLRLGIFVGVFLLLASLEAFAPRRVLTQRKGKRWMANLTLTALNTLLVRVTVGALAVQAALIAQERQWGVLTLLALPLWVQGVLSVLVLDFAIYVQHVLAHALPVFWRLHMVHHTDRDLDVTTGLRFHPLEIVVSMLYKAAVVLVLGAPPGAVLVFEVLLNATAQFNHSNLRLPEACERWVRYVLVTPDVHRIHHSVVAAETQTNFGFSVPWWDRLCGTYLDQPAQPHSRMALGIAGDQCTQPLQALQLLRLPWQPSLLSAHERLPS